MPGACDGKDCIHPKMMFCSPFPCFPTATLFLHFLYWYSLTPRWDVIYRWLWLNSVSHKTPRYECEERVYMEEWGYKKVGGGKRVPGGRLFKTHHTHMKVSNVIKAMKIEQKCWEEISNSVTDRFLYILESRGVVCSARKSYHLVWRATKRKKTCIIWGPFDQSFTKKHHAPGIGILLNYTMAYSKRLSKHSGYLLNEDNEYLH